MKNLIQFSVNKAITVFMVVIAVAVFGFVSFTRLTTDLFPNVNIPFAVVVTTYPGASPEEVESDVSIPLEQALQTTTNVVELTSMSQENVSMMMIEFNAATNMNAAVVEMRESIGLVLNQLPEEAGNPMIIRLNPDMIPIMTFSVTYEGKDLQALTDWVDNELGPQIERVPGVASMMISGAYEAEIRVLLDQDAIDVFNSQIDDLNAMLPPEDQIDFTLDKAYIGDVLMGHDFSFPAGFVSVSGVDYLVRVGDAIDSLEEMEDLIIVSLPGALDDVKLSDIAEVTFAPADERTYSKVNGENALTIAIQKGSEYATTDVTQGVNAVIASMMDDDDDINVTMLFDQGEYISASTGSVTNNLIIGGVLALIILFIFLRNLGVTLIVGVAIPISLLFAIVLIYLSGITLNLVSLGGLALGIGMLVDNSIVVMENIFRMRKEGASRTEAAIVGTYQVAGAITASTLTTIGVFLPIMFIEDFIREIFYQLALTVAFSLAASLAIALTLVPALAGRIMRENNAPAKTRQKPTVFERLHEVYGRAIEKLLKFRGLVIAGVLVLFAGSVLLATGRGFEFFPTSDEGTLTISVEMDPDAPLDFDDFSNTLDRLHDDLRDFDDVKTVGISLGGGMMGMFGQTATDRANINVVLRPDRDMSTEAFREAVIELLDRDYDTLVFEVQGTQGDVAMLTGQGIQLRLKGADLDVLRAEALELVDMLESIDGLREIDPGFGRESREIKITVDKQAAAQYVDMLSAMDGNPKPLTVESIWMMVAVEIAGAQPIGNVRLDNRSYAMYVYEEGDVKRKEMSIEAIQNTVVGVNLTSMGGDFEFVTLGEVAEVVMQPGFATITRVDGVRSLTISAEYASGVNTTQVAADVAQALEAHMLPTGYTVDILGEDEEIQAAIETLLLMAVLAIALVYMIMASQFQSLLYPFIIMITIPLAFTGGFLILYIFGMRVSIVAMVGLIVLAGVVVNNGIVLVDYINQLRAGGMELKEAIIEGGKVRMRPIFMTALTTILALSAMAIGFGDGAELIQPLALTAIGGLIYATLLTIFVVPLLYYSFTIRGKYIFGGLFAFLSAAVAGYMFYDSMWLYGIIATAVAAVFLIITWFLPDAPLQVNTDDKTRTTDDNDVESFIQGMMK